MTATEKQLDLFIPESNQTMILGDCLEVMRGMQSNSIDFVVTDPPYGLHFMGKDWDDRIPSIEIWAEALRICKPGAMLAAFGGSRTHHHLMCAIEGAGWEIKDVIMWIYGSGFPKGHNISLAIDKAKNYEREIIGIRSSFRPNSKPNADWFQDRSSGKITAPASDLAKTFSGFSTALKPAYEPIILAMKPLEGTYAQNAEKWGVAGLNIDESRVVSLTGQRPSDIISEKEIIWEQEKCLCPSCANLVVSRMKQEIPEIGEFSVIKDVALILKEKGKQILTNLSITDIGCLGILFQEEQSTNQKENSFLNMSKFGKMQTDLSQKDSLYITLTITLSITDLKICNLCKEEITSDIINLNIQVLKKEKQNMQSEQKKNVPAARWPANLILDEEAAAELDTMTGNNVSRFFYCAKASSAERNRGLDKSSSHPTIKPIALMKYILKLLAPPGSPICLDPFAGSGSTLVAAKELGINCIGIEKEPEYFEIAKKRIEF
jgi:DNA modification methylase